MATETALEAKVMDISGGTFALPKVIKLMAVVNEQNDITHNGDGYWFWTLGCGKCSYSRISEFRKHYGRYASRAVSHIPVLWLVLSFW